MKASQRAGALAAVLLGMLAALALSLPASAATTVTITLNINGPSPASATAVAGDTIVFSNGDNVSHTVTHKTGAWTYTKTIAANGRGSVVLTGAGSYSYTDSHALLLSTANDPGSITVTAAKPSPAPTAKPSATVAPKPSVSAKPSGSASPASSASPATIPTGGTGTAVGPGLGVGVVPNASAPAPSGGPAPNIAPEAVASPGEPTPTTSAPAAATAVGRGLVQGSAHRFGLPMALAVVAVAGVASLIVRLLLAQPAARPSEQS